MCSNTIVEKLSCFRNQDKSGLNSLLYWWQLTTHSCPFPCLISSSGEKGKYYLHFLEEGRDWKGIYCRRRMFQLKNGFSNKKNGGVIHSTVKLFLLERFTEEEVDKMIGEHYRIREGFELLKSHGSLYVPNDLSELVIEFIQ